MADKPFNSQINAGQRAAELTPGAGGLRNIINPNQNLPGALNTDEALRDDRSQKLYDSNNITNQAVGMYGAGQKQAVNKQQYSNLARTNQLTGKNYSETERLSRLADALNNRRWWRSGDIGTRTLKGGAQGIELGRSERWEPIETQEMRQMRQNEGIANKVRQEQAQLQADVNRHALDIRKAGDEMAMGQQRQYAAIDPQMEAAFRQISADLNYKLPATTSLSMYVQTMAQYIANQVNYDLANDFYAVWKNNPVLSSILANRTGDLPLSQKAYLTDVARQEWIKRKEAEFGRKLNANEMQEAMAISDRLTDSIFSMAETAAYNSGAVTVPNAQANAGKQTGKLDYAYGDYGLSESVRRALEKNQKKVDKQVAKAEKKITKAQQKADKKAAKENA